MAANVFNGTSYTLRANIEAAGNWLYALAKLTHMRKNKEGEYAILNIPFAQYIKADFDFAKSLCFSAHAVQRGVAALADGASVVTDTTMVAAGINKRVLASFGGAVHTFVANADVAEEARRRGVTRSAVSMERAAELKGPLVFAIGNAPTALIALDRLMREGALVPPALVIGVPVGFVNVVESKELIMRSGAEHIVARGRKGGSTVAAAICNALLYLASNDRRW